MTPNTNAAARKLARDLRINDTVTVDGEAGTITGYCGAARVWVKFASGREGTFLRSSCTAAEVSPAPAADDGHGAGCTFPRGCNCHKAPAPAAPVACVHCEEPTDRHNEWCRLYAPPAAAPASREERLQGALMALIVAIRTSPTAATGAADRASEVLLEVAAEQRAENDTARAREAAGPLPYVGKVARADGRVVTVVVPGRDELEAPAAPDAYASAVKAAFGAAPCRCGHRAGLHGTAAPHRCGLCNGPLGRMATLGACEGFQPAPTV